MTAIHDIAELVEQTERASHDVHAAIALVRERMLRFDTLAGQLRNAVEQIGPDSYETATLTDGLRLVAPDPGQHSVRHDRIRVGGHLFEAKARR